MELLTLKIRGDLHAHNQEMRARWTARWRGLQLLTLGVGLLIAIYSLFPQHWPIQQAVPLLMFAPLLLMAGLQPFIFATRRPNLVTAVMAVVFILLALAAGLLHPLSPAKHRLLPEWSAWLSLLIPLISWMILIRLILNSRAQARHYSLRTSSFVMNGLIGLACGAGLALHLFLVGYYVTGATFPAAMFDRESILWMVSILIGIVVPAEEIIFRGAAFSTLYDELNTRFSDAVWRITSLDVLVYLVILAISKPDLPFALLTLLYRAGLSAISLYLVQRRRSLLPAMMANLAFSLATGWLFFG